MAPSLGYRFICPNRRLYPGSTPYTKEEADAFHPGRSTEEVLRVYLKQGEYLLLFVDNMIREQGLKKVLITGWSLGAGFLSAMVCSLTSFEDPARERLRRVVKALVWHDPPSSILGVPDPPTGGWVPLYDKSLTPEERQRSFGQWVVQYFPHPNVEERDFRKLIYKNTPAQTQAQQSTYTDLTPEDMLQMIDLHAGDKGDSFLGGEDFIPIGKAVWDLSFFSEETREAWGDVPFSVLFGEESTWTVIWASWKLAEEAVERAMQVRCIGIPGVNHFPMQDHPDVLFDAYLKCL
ncbi:hypothetical protein D9613_012561 [Agrocybe pediades]|uniref:AB hydrolase-1 domain-containing protein n=1 Tax=Agrocybe pediades TaxID=84607 RepID=A0A8H4QS36_9AGAR|nr:hypothetical protein D9613_012561 [Agrocybe pediades]